MKKIYQNPEITVIVMQTTLMNATSMELVGGDAQSPGMSRDFDDWDE